MENNHVFYVTMQEVANAMSEAVHRYIRPEQIVLLPPETVHMNIYCAQSGNMTVLCWARVDGTFRVKHTYW